MKNVFSLLLVIAFAPVLRAQSPGNSLHFDGANDYVSTSLPTVFNNISGNSLTIEAWVKPTGSVFSRIVFAQLNASSFVTMSTSTSNQIYFYVNNTVSAVTSAALPLNQWSHVACTWDGPGSAIQIYFNGVLMSTAGGGTSSTGNDNMMTIGSRTNGAQYFPGELDELRIWDDIRTPCEISGGMYTSFTTAQPNLVAYYQFDQGTAAGNNTGISSLTEFTGAYDGTFQNFALNGGTSNFLTSGATITQNNIAIVSGTDVISSCEPYTWIDGNTYATSNNTATYTLVGGAANGCDSLAMLDLTILSPSSGTDMIAACGPVTWIDGNIYTASNNTATYTITGGAANGCDSLVTLDLTINTVNTGTSVSGLTISASTSGATYQWLDCDNGYAPLSGETNASYTATANGNYAVQVTENGCTDTSACVAITTVGVEDVWMESFTLYPNPTHSGVTLRFHDLPAVGTLFVRDASGRVLRSFQPDATSEMYLDLPYPGGVYFIGLSGGEHGNAVVRVVKE